MAEASGWYVIGGDGKTCGPYNAANIRKFASDGVIGPETKISKDKTVWHPAGNVKGLFPDAPVPASKVAPVAPAPSQQVVHHYQNYNAELEAMKIFKQQESLAKIKKAKSLKSSL